MTTTVKVSVNGNYRATVTQEGKDPVVLDGNSGGGPGTNEFTVVNEARFTVTEESRMSEAGQNRNQDHDGRPDFNTKTGEPPRR